MNGIKEVLENYIAGCQGKAKTSSMRIFVKAILGGMMIGFGAAAGNVAGHAIGNVGLARVAAAVVFPVGLMMIITMGYELFTGDCLAIMANMEGKQTIGQFIRLLVLVYIGNLIGGTLLSGMIYMSGQFDYSSGLLGAYTIKVALGKANLSFSTALISGILCNILVCIAVLMAGCAKDVAGKLLAVFFTIFLFVISGYEHCVANMYYITAGLFAKQNPDYVKVAMDTYGLTSDKLDTLNIKNYMVGNLIPVSIGNIIGGGIVVGAILIYLNHTKKEADK